MYFRVHPYVLFVLRIVQVVFTLGTLIPVAANVDGMRDYDNYENLILVEPLQIYLFVTCGLTLIYVLPMALYELLGKPGAMANTFRYISDGFMALFWAVLLGIAIWRAATAEEYDYITQDFVIYAIPALTGITLILFLISMFLISSQRRDSKTRARLFRKEYPETVEMNNFQPEPVRTCDCNNVSYTLPRLAIATPPRQDTKGHFELHSPLERVELESPASDYGTVMSPPPTYNSNSHIMVGSKEALAGPSRRSQA